MLLILSFPKFGNGLLAWVALVPLLVSLHGATGWRAARLGYVTGAVSAVGLLYWTAFVVFQYGGGIPRVVAVLITLALCFAFAVFPLAFGWATGRLLAAFGTRGLLGAPVLWVATPPDAPRKPASTCLVVVLPTLPVTQTTVVPASRRRRRRA